MLRLGIIFYILVIINAEDIENNSIDSNTEENKVTNKSLQNSDVCHSTECFQIANDIWQSMNQSVNPCDDFYEYACGGFAASNPVPKSELSWGTIQKLRKTVKLRILGIVTAQENATDILPVRQVKKFYRSCVSYWHIGIRGLKHIKAFLAQNGGWPLIMEQEEWSSKKISWKEINQFYSRLLFMSSFYRVYVTNEYKKLNDSSLDIDNPFKVIKILPPGVPLKNMAIYSGKIVNENLTAMYDDGSYGNYTARIARMLAYSRSANISNEQMQKDVEDMIALEKKFYNMTIDYDSEPQFVKIDELQEIYDKEMKTPEKSKINWKKIITEHFNEAKVELDGDELFQIRSSDHFQILADILENTDPRTLANYMHWHFVSFLLPYSTLVMQALRIHLFKDKEGAELRPRWLNCVRNLEMPQVIAHQYVKKYFDSDAKDKVEQVFLSIQKQMAKHIEEADWLSDETKQDELKKINNMKINIGFPEWLKNETALTERYQGLVIGNQYMENIINIKRFNRKARLQFLKSTARIKEWYAHPLYVNAFFFQYKNILNVPTAALQPPLFSVLQPNTVNYGELGYIISHEVAHGFDNSGMQIDQFGKKYVWPENMKEVIKEKTECFASHFDNFTSANTKKISNEKVRDDILNENLSDSVGINIVFSALEEIEKVNKSLQLPGFEHWDNRKIFFLSFARMYCHNERPGFEKAIQKYRRHGMPKYRVNAPLQNSDHFAKVFNCPVDSPMNPNSKCKLW